MSRISDKFNELKEQNKKALIAFITAGDPSLKITAELVLELERAGADIVELGVPFSDPLADGPTIQASHLRALKNDVSLDGVFKLVKKLRTRSKIPVVLMLSYNIILRHGIGDFVRDSLKAGVDGVISPDLPWDEAEEFLKAAKGIDTILLVAPTSTDERAKSIAEASRGFIYLISLTGITGARKSLSEDVQANVQRIRKYSKTPIAVGFGISSPAQISEISRYADGVIVGSAIVRVVENNLGKRDIVKKVGNFVRSLRRAA